MKAVPAVIGAVYTWFLLVSAETRGRRPSKLLSFLVTRATASGLPC